jgi:hypothetical protein
MTAPLAVLAFLALASLTAAAYTQSRLARFTSGRYKRTGTSTLLVIVGMAIGYLGSRMFAEPAMVVLAFVFGFGVVHMPAACILLLKRLRGEAPS